MSVFKKILTGILGDENAKKIRKYEVKVAEINALESKMSKLTDEEIRAKTQYFKDYLKKEVKGLEEQQIHSSSEVDEHFEKKLKDALDDILVEAFALVREASKRTLGMRHFDVQLIGGMALHDGNIAEMKTGEGKTLVATLAVYLNALAGRGVHVITVNDYLVKRDCEWMGRLYGFLGLSVGFVTGGMEPEDRAVEYAKDITYVSNTEIGFDYLRDNMKDSLSEMAVVSRGFNFAVIDEVDSILIDESRTPLIISGPAQHDPQMYVVINEIIKQLVPEDYEIDEKRKSVQLTETGNTHIEQLLKQEQILGANDDLYGANSFALLNFILQALRAHTLFKNGTDYIVKDGQAMIIDEFTGRIMDGRRYSDGLHQAIEAKEGLEVAPENQTLASITYQNFFRMYKKLSGMTGTASTEAAEFYDIYKLPIVSIPTNKPVIRQSLDDMVFRNEEDKFEAIIKTVEEAHAKGQPILIGTVSIDKSERLSELLNKAGIKHNLLNAKYHEQEAKIIAEAGRLGAVTIATNMAGRGTDIMLGGNVQKEIDAAIEEAQKKVDDNHELNDTLSAIRSLTGNKDENKSANSQKVDAVAIANAIREKHKAEYQQVVDAGGLFVIGSERHESRRIDNQLIGRAGRQGDPGKTQFFLSLHDNLLRIFGGDKLESILSHVGFKPGEALNHPMLNSIINKSQKKVESFHYEIRKNLLKYDDIVNEQRKIIYEQRMAIVKSQNVGHILDQIVNDVNEDILANATINGEIVPVELKNRMQQVYFVEKGEMNFTQYNIDVMNNFCKFKYAERFNPVDIFTLQDIQRSVMLSTLDECWREHLYYLDHIKEGIHLRAYAHKDPFSEYKFESFSLMQQTMNKFIYKVVSRLFTLRIRIENDEITKIQDGRNGAPVDTLLDEIQEQEPVDGEDKEYDE